MTPRRTPGPYDRNLLAAAPTGRYGAHQNYDMRLLNAQPPVVNPDVPTEVEETPSPQPIALTRTGPFWETKAGKIVIAVVVIVVLIIALIGGSLGAAAAASFHHTHTAFESTPLSDASPLSEGPNAPTTSLTSTESTTTTTFEMTPPATITTGRGTPITSAIEPT